MPYRGALEPTLARCAKLQERARDLERVLGLTCRPSIRIAARDYGDACALERKLEARVHELEEERAQRFAEENGVVTIGDGAVPQNEEPFRLQPLTVLALVMTVVGCITVLVIQFASPDEGVRPVRRSYLAAGNVKSGAPQSRCAIYIDLDHDACNVDVVCPTIERRGHATNCIGADRSIAPQIPGVLEIDGAHGTARLIDEHGGRIDIELDAWR
jgi:hypothetical protein